MQLADVQTPALILNRPKMQANVARLHKHLGTLGMPLRPHLKTCKSIDVARHMLTGQPGGATVSTLAEARYFFAHGISDLTYAVPIAPSKLSEVAGLMTQGLDLTILLDSAETAQRVAEFGEANGVVFKALLEIDSDGHRTGFKPDADRLIEAGSILHASSGADLCGVLTHAGSSYGCEDAAGITAMAEQERAATVGAAERLRAAGLPCRVVSVGSTPTAHFAAHLDGVTEVRAGVFVFSDLFQANLGVCALDDIAVGVLAEIIGRDLETGRLFIDAGALALSKDRSTAGAREDMGYGLASRPGDRVEGAELIVSQVFQEHGILTPRSGSADADLSRYEIGERLMIWPNHSCMTVAAHGLYHVTDDGETIAEQWSRVNGWRNADSAVLLEGAA